MRPLAFVIAALLLPAAAQAEPPLLGRSAPGPFRQVDKNLAPAAGKLRLPSGTFGSVISPDRRRFVAYGAGRPTLFDRKTGRRLRRLPQVGGYVLEWAGNRHLVAYGPFPGVPRDVFQSLNLRTGKVRTQPSAGAFSDMEVAGRRARLLTEGDDRAQLDVFGAGGRRLRTVPIPFPAGVESFEVGVSLRGQTLLYTSIDQAGHSRFWLATPGGEPRPVDLPGFVYQWIADDLIVDASGGHAALIDPEALTVREVIETLPGQFVAPLRDGFMLGLGRQVYDGSLRLRADNPDAEKPQTPVVVHGGRLYARTFTCFPFTSGAVIADADTGKILKRLGGSYAFGELGTYLTQPNDDDCD